MVSRIFSFKCSFVSGLSRITLFFISGPPKVVNSVPLQLLQLTGSIPLQYTQRKVWAKVQPIINLKIQWNKNRFEIFPNLISCCKFQFFLLEKKYYIIHMAAPPCLTVLNLIVSIFVNFFEFMGSYLGNGITG